jgi:uncharacterized damage-inducible protein DinB
MPLFFSFAQVREDLARHASGLSDAQVWRQVDRASVGFHLKHLAGSVDRITTYLLDGQLSPPQLAFLQQESAPDLTVDALLRLVDESLRHSEDLLRTLDPGALYDARKVGRKELPSTVIGLLVHLAEHTHRHLGQAITMCKMVRQFG